MLPIEYHPFEPFLPDGGRLLMLGSFPPAPERWSMEFYYPNFRNDMWRIVGLLFFGDKEYFVESACRFDRTRIEAFCREKGIALYDTARAVRRLRGNASDKFLEVVEPADTGALLRRLPLCRAVVVTGEKAAETLAASFGCKAPRTGEREPFEFDGREMMLYRMPSSSRAYPLSVERKAEAYRRVFADVGML
ncbi:MAG: uracil-DNA glycosylase family protein [Alistipes sp.]|nr:uracil-DNA glycosylase family protein [Alistipes sp.]